MRKKKHAGKRANDLDREIKSLRRQINRCRASIKQIREALWYAYYVTPPIELDIIISKM